MFKKLLSFLPVLLVGAVLNGMVSATLAESATHRGELRPQPERMREFIKARLDKLANRLEIKASQQQAWEAFAKAVTALADRPVKHPDENADAATIAHFRADMVADMAKKLSAIADATDKLAAVLNADQRKVLNEEFRRFQRGGHWGAHPDQQPGARENQQGERPEEQKPQRGDGAGRVD